MNEFDEDESLTKFFEEKFADQSEDHAAGTDQRVGRIEERALFQSTLKQSTSFVFESFSTVITNLVASLCGHVPPNDPQNDYKP